MKFAMFFFGALLLQGSVLSQHLTSCMHVAYTNTQYGRPMNQATPIPQFDIVDLGVLAGSSRTAFPTSTACQLNDHAEIVGESSTRGAHSHAFMWKDGKMLDLGPSRFQDSAANGINSSRVIVGRLVKWQIPDSLLGVTRAVQWKGGKMTELPRWKGGKNSRAMCVNDSGQIVGSMDISTHEQTVHACLWEGKRITDLSMLPNGVASNAHAINAKGQVVGYCLLKNKDGNDRMRACLWMQGKVIDLGPPHTQESQAFALNDNGVIAGYFRIQNDKPGTHACLFDNGKITDLGGLPGCNDTEAYGINNAMQVVGNSSNFEHNQIRAFLLESGHMYDLNDCIDPQSGWVLQFAKAINNKGEIVGYGNIQGKRHAFLLKPHARKARE